MVFKHLPCLTNSSCPHSLQQRQHRVTSLHSVGIAVAPYGTEGGGHSPAMHKGASAWQKTSVHTIVQSRVRLSLPPSLERAQSP